MPAAVETPIGPTAAAKLGRCNRRLAEIERCDGSEGAVVKTQALMHHANPLGILLEPAAGGHMAREAARVDAALADHVAVISAEPTGPEARD